MTISRGFMPVNVYNGHHLVWSIVCAHDFMDPKCTSSHQKSTTTLQSGPTHFIWHPYNLLLQDPT